MIGIDALIAVGGLVIPPLFDFVKKKFLKKGEDTPEATISSLATTKPEVLPEYTNALSKLLEAKVKWFNRDVVGQIYPFIASWRAAIRPFVITFAILHIIFSWAFQIPLDPNVRSFYVAIISEWFGERLTLDK